MQKYDKNLDKLQLQKNNGISKSRGFDEPCLGFFLVPSTLTIKKSRKHVNVFINKYTSLYTDMLEIKTVLFSVSVSALSGMVIRKL